MTIIKATEEVAGRFCVYREEGFEIEALSYWKDRWKTIEGGPAVLITNTPSAVTLGERRLERTGRSEWDEEGEKTWREVRISPLPPEGWVVLKTSRKYSGDEMIIYHILLGGEVGMGEVIRGVVIPLT